MSGSLDNFHAEDSISVPVVSTDAGTINFKFTVSVLEEGHAWVDVTTVFFDLQPITTEEIKCGFRIDLISQYQTRKWSGFAYNKWSAEEQSRKWTGDVTALPVPDPC